MENLLLSFNAIVPMFLVMATGYLAQRLGVLKRRDVPGINRVAFRIFLPCLLFYNIYSSDLSSAVQTRTLVFAVCGVLAVFGAAVLIAAHLVPQQDRKGVIAQGIFRSNFVILGLPIAQALAGDKSLGSVAILIAVIVPIFNFLAVFVLEYYRGGNVKAGTVLTEIVKNPLIVSSVLGILFQLLHLHLPGVAEKAVANLGSIATPLQLFLLGAFFRFRGMGRYRKPLMAVTAIKLFVTPAVALSAAAAIGIRGVELIGLMGIFASPTAVNSFTMVQQMHCGDEELAGDIVVATSAVSILSFFLWIFVFKTLGFF